EGTRRDGVWTRAERIDASGKFAVSVQVVDQVFSAWPARFTRSALRPQDAEGYIERGNSHLAMEEVQDALNDAGRAIQLNPKLAAPYSLRGAVLRKLGRYPEAVKDLTQAVQLSPDMDNYFQLGAAYQEIGDDNQAIENFNQVISFDPLSSQPYYARAKSYRAVGDMVSAQRDHRLGRILDGAVE
ncbi:MAG: tetratricopeptide repeat protein, partial [Acidobacteriota bacterium]